MLGRRYIQNDFIVNIMEDQRKKYLLSRIKKEELIIQTDYDKFKQIYQARNVPEQRNQAYLELTVHIIQHNDTFALNLIQYLQKTQIKHIFERNKAIFIDLSQKYKKVYNDWRSAEEGKNKQQIREICQICQQKIESNHIENIKNILDRQSETRSAMIQKIIEQSQKERNRPLFTFQQDQLFKQELQKVLKKKQISIQHNANESNIFLQTVTHQITDFMISFRKDFANWENVQQQETSNWSNIMKSYLNKKLTNSFQDKIPKWIKKMHQTFVQNQPVKPKIYFVSRQVQTNQFNPQVQINLKHEINDLRAKLNHKQELIKEYSSNLQLQKIKNKGLKSQLHNLQKYMVEKVYQTKQIKKNEFGQEPNADSYNGSIVKNIQGKSNKMLSQSGLTDINQRPIVSTSKSKNKVAKMLSIQSKNKQNIRVNTDKDERDTIFRSYNNMNQQIQTAQIEKIKASIHQNNINKSQDPHSDTTNIISRISSTNQVLEPAQNQDGLLKLKKKKYNRERRQQLLNTKKPQQQMKANNNNKLVNSNIPVSKLKQEVKNIATKLKNSNQLLMSPLINKQQRQDLYFPTQINKQIIQKNQIKYQNSQKCLKSTLQEQVQTQKVKLQLKNELKHKIIQQTECNKKNNKSSQKKSGKNIYFENETQVKIKQHIQNIKTQNLSAYEHELREVSCLIQKYLSQCNAQKKVKNKSKINNLPEIIANEQFQMQSINHNRSIAKEKENSYNQKQERQYKSLHVSKHPQKKQMIVKLPKINKKQNGSRQKQFKKQLYQFDLNQSNIILFIDDQNAFNYQQSFSQIQNQKHLAKTTPIQRQQILQIFSLIQVIKVKNHSLYLQLCSFLRHPYTSIKSHFLTLDAINDINAAMFNNCFLKILWVHRKCKVRQPQKFCLHVSTFINNLKEMAKVGELYNRSVALINN